MANIVRVYWANGNAKSLSARFGRFTVCGVAPGNYTILAWDEVELNVWTNSEFLPEFGQRGTKVTVRAGTPGQVTRREGE
jgi:hypothetical protein